MCFGQTLEWAKNYGDSASESNYSISVDGQGNSYVTGSLYTIAKYDSNGDYVWGHNIGGSVLPSSISTDLFDNAYVTGRFEDTAVVISGLDTITLISKGGSDVFIAKYAPNGNCDWAFGLGGASSTQALGITTDPFGNVIITGSFRDTVDFDPGLDSTILVTNAVEDLFLAKYDSSGNLVWAKGTDATWYAKGYSIDSDDLGDLYITGDFGDTVDFDPGSGIAMLISSAYMTDIFVAKYDAAGNYLWAQGMGGSESCRGESIAVDLDKSVYITGWFIDTVDFDPGPATSILVSDNYTPDIFIAKYDYTGNYLWVKGIGAAGNEEGKSIATNSSGEVIFIGHFNDTLDFDPGSSSGLLTTTGWQGDLFMAKYNSIGGFIWAHSLGTSSGIYGTGIAVGNDDDILLTGFFSNSVDFDPDPDTFNLSAVPSWISDVFIAKYKDDPITGISDLETASAMNDFHLYPNPFENNLNINYTLADNASVNIEIYNSLGMKMKSIEAGKQQHKGSYDLHITIDDHSPGLYYIKLTADDNVVSKKAIYIGN